MTETTCDWCGKPIKVKNYKMRTQKHHFCCRACLWKYSSKEINPEHYDDLKDLTNQSKHMSQMNRDLNAFRMTADVRLKLRERHLKEEDEVKPDVYRKYLGQLEHRYVMEQIIGRPLMPGEVVHHINGDKHDNRPVNLMLFKSQSEHAEWHQFFGIFDPLTGKEVVPDEIPAS